MVLFTPDQVRSFQNADPFPHIVVDNFWDHDLLARAYEQFASPADPRWKTYRETQEWGKRCMDEPLTWSNGVAQMMSHMASPSVVEALEDLTGFKGLTADWVGGGAHMTGEGGRLDMHVDFNVHPDGKRLRKLNVLVFMNPEWDPLWGGVLYLGEHKEVEVIPTWNRMVIFECSDKSWHGHPEPVTRDQWRRSLACYYYVPVSEGDDVQPHTTTWLSR